MNLPTNPLALAGPIARKAGGTQPITAQPLPPTGMMEAWARQGSNPLQEMQAFQESYAPAQPQPSRKTGRANPLGDAMPAMNAAPAQTEAAMPMPQQQGNPLGAAFGSFARGFLGPERTGALDEQHKARGDERLTKQKVWLEQTARQPMEQRVAFTQRFAREIAADTGVPVETILASLGDPNEFSDQSIQAGIAALSAQLGQGPTAKEFQYFQGQDGAISQVEKGTGDFRQINPGTPKPREPIKMGDGTLLDPETYEVLYDAPDQPSGADWQQFTDASGQLWEYQRGVPGSERKVEVPRGRVLGSDGGGREPTLTPNQLLTAQLKIDDLDRELADVERGRKSSLSTVTSSIALLEDFLSPANTDTFNEVYGNWINPTGEGNDFLNPRVTPGSKRANGMAILEQLGGRAFLDSIQAMKGTGALSDREGAKVWAAATRLMQVTQDDDAARRAGQEFLVTLQSYKAALENGIQASRAAEASRRQQVASMMGVPAPAQQPGGQPSPSASTAPVGQPGQPSKTGAGAVLRSAMQFATPPAGSGISPEEWSVMDEADRALFQ